MAIAAGHPVIPNDGIHKPGIDGQDIIQGFVVPARTPADLNQSPVGAKLGLLKLLVKLRHPLSTVNFSGTSRIPGSPGSGHAH